METIHMTSTSITFETTACATQSALREVIELDQDNADTISLTNSNEDLTSEGELTVEYAMEPEVPTSEGELIAEYTMEPEVPTAGTFDYTSDILNESNNDASDIGTRDYLNVVMPSGIIQESDNIAEAVVDSLQIKQECLDFTDYSTSGFMSDGGAST